MLNMNLNYIIMRKTLNKLGNILYYTFNIATMPFIISYLCYHIPEQVVLRNDVGQDGSTPIVTIVLIILTWILQFRLYSVFDKKKGFGLDFYKYREFYEKLSARKPLFNPKGEDYGLFNLYKTYCNDEKICMIHQMESYDRSTPDVENISQLDLNLLYGFNNAHVANKGYTINLNEEPSLFLAKVNSQFYPRFASYGFCKYFKRFLISEIDRCKLSVGKDNVEVDSDYDVVIHEHCIVMGTLVEIISTEQYKELKELHKNGEKNHDMYMLKKRQDEIKAAE